MYCRISSYQAMRNAYKRSVEAVYKSNSTKMWQSLTWIAFRSSRHRSWGVVRCSMRELDRSDACWLWLRLHHDGLLMHHVRYMVLWHGHRLHGLLHLNHHRRWTSHPHRRWELAHPETPPQEMRELLRSPKTQIKFSDSDSDSDQKRLRFQPKSVTKVKRENQGFRVLRCDVVEK
jgi:hypothetical protein